MWLGLILLWPGEKKEYAITLPLCKKCKFHHNGRALQSVRTARELVTRLGIVGILLLLTIKKTLTCFKCGNQGHYNSDCRKLKNQGRGNQSKNGEARGRVYALGGGEADQDLNDDLNYIDA
ncbi:reverse transcriptase domain-containing protein [Tanacetum coccineum]